MRSKFFSLTLFLLLVMPVFAQQNAKRVAILKVVDQEGKVPYGVKLQLRSSLIYAISHTEGYEALERVDLPSIMDEQKFQRSGLVSEAQIKEIGRMNGADYVLVAEAALYDKSNILVTAKLLDVVTGRIKESADPQTAPKNPEKMKEACIRIARTLLKKKKNEFGYTDLGLPSGTIWKNDNESGYYNSFEALTRCGNRIPTKKQWEELVDKCSWRWMGNAYIVTGPNGNSIILPAEGSECNGGEMFHVGKLGYYLTSSSYDSEHAWNFFFSATQRYTSPCNLYLRQSIRMVQND